MCQYKKDWNPDPLEEPLTVWKISRFVRGECESYYEPGYRTYQPAGFSMGTTIRYQMGHTYVELEGGLGYCVFREPRDVELIPSVFSSAYLLKCVAPKGARIREGVRTNREIAVSKLKVEERTPLTYDYETEEWWGLFRLPSKVNGERIPLTLKEGMGEWRWVPLNSIQVYAGKPWVENMEECRETMDEKVASWE